MSFLPSVGLDSRIWYFIENYVYHVPDPPPRTRTAPMELICVGPSRSGTESLQVALLSLGLDHTYHGWDLVFDRPTPYAAWARLAKRKFYGRGADNIENKPITRADFDKLLGHAVAVTDTAGFIFAEELIAAYPEAKVVLNYRSDLDAWQASFIKTLIGSFISWRIYLISLFEAEMWWALHASGRIMMPNFLGMPYGSRPLQVAAVENGKMAYRNHCNKIRGLVPKERLLEWTVQDGWAPLCKFLGKEVPNEPFPHVNASGTGAGYSGREQAAIKIWIRHAAINFFLVSGGVGLAIWAGVKYDVFPRLY